MAGGGIGVPPSTLPATKPASPVPSGQPLDGSPKFEAAAPVDLNAATAPATPAAQPGTSFAGFPPWLSQWAGASFGGSNQPSTLPSNYRPYVPGTGFSGYGAPRAPNIYRPPTKPVSSNSAVGNGLDIDSLLQLEGVANYNPSLSTTPPTADQEKLMRLRKLFGGSQSPYDWGSGNGGNSGGGYGGSQSGGGGAGGLY